MNSALINKSPGVKGASWLLKAKATSIAGSYHFWIITILLAVFTYIYYGILTAFHDVYLIIFFYPLLYAAVSFRLRGVIICSLAILGILLPQFFLSIYDIYSLARVLLFAAFAFLISGLGATLLNYLEHQMAAYEEIVSLNHELNNYIQRLENTQKQLIQSEKLNALGQLAASVAHEINNPLAGVLVYAKLLSKKLTGGSLGKEEGLEDLGKIETAINHCSHIIRSLLDFSRQSEPVLKPVTVSSVIDGVMSLVGHQAEMKNIEVVRDEVNPSPVVVADFQQLQQVLVNLFVNAIQAMPANGRLTIRYALEDNSWVNISVEDTGCGIPPENLDKLFTPFFTTREEVKGVGLGLAVSYGIIERHGGRIEVQSEVGKGSIFTVILPAYSDDIKSGE